MDIADQSQLELEQINAHQKINLKQEAEPTGYCLFCGEPLTDNKRWCDADCRDMWEKEQNAKKKA